MYPVKRVAVHYCAHKSPILQEEFSLTHSFHFNINSILPSEPMVSKILFVVRIPYEFLVFQMHGIVHSVFLGLITVMVLEIGVIFGGQ
jgi:hypothetical protein